MKEKDKVLNKYSLKKHSLHFNQLINMYDRAIILELALEEVLATKIANPSKKLSNDLCPDVSNQRELLIAFFKYCEKYHFINPTGNYEDIIKDFRTKSNL